jgi:hypothetical protein
MQKNVLTQALSLTALHKEKYLMSSLKLAGIALLLGSMMPIGSTDASPQKDGIGRDTSLTCSQWSDTLLFCCEGDKCGFVEVTEPVDP